MKMRMEGHKTDEAGCLVVEVLLRRWIMDDGQDGRCAKTEKWTQSYKGSLLAPDYQVPTRN